MAILQLDAQIPTPANSPVQDANRGLDALTNISSSGSAFRNEALDPSAQTITGPTSNIAAIYDLEPLRFATTNQAPEQSKEITSDQVKKIILDAKSGDDARLELERIFDSATPAQRESVRSAINQGIEEAKKDPNISSDKRTLHAEFITGDFFAESRQRSKPQAPVATPAPIPTEPLVTEAVEKPHTATPSPVAAPQQEAAVIKSSELSASIADMDKSNFKVFLAVGRELRGASEERKLEIAEDIKQGLAELKLAREIVGTDIPEALEELDRRESGIRSLATRNGLKLDASAPVATVEVTSAPKAIAIEAKPIATPEVKVEPAAELLTQAQVLAKVRSLVLDSHLGATDPAKQPQHAMAEIEKLYKQDQYRVAVLDGFSDATQRQLARAIHLAQSPQERAELNARMTYFLSEAARPDGLDTRYVDPRTKVAPVAPSTPRAQSTAAPVTAATVAATATGTTVEIRPTSQPNPAPEKAPEAQKPIINLDIEAKRQAAVDAIANPELTPRQRNAIARDLIKSDLPIHIKQQLAYEIATEASARVLAEGRFPVTAPESNPGETTTTSIIKGLREELAPAFPKGEMRDGFKTAVNSVVKNYVVEQYNRSTHRESYMFRGDDIAQEFMLDKRSPFYSEIKASRDAAVLRINSAQQAERDQTAAAAKASADAEVARLQSLFRGVTPSNWNAQMAAIISQRSDPSVKIEKTFRETGVVEAIAADIAERMKQGDVEGAKAQAFALGAMTDMFDEKIFDGLNSRAAAALNTSLRNVYASSPHGLPVNGQSVGELKVHHQTIADFYIKGYQSRLAFEEGMVNIG